MATFTIELWRVLDLYPEESPTFENIGLDEYPIFQAGYREQLNRKIVNHYHNREIGTETVSMFKFAMRRKMAEIMPFYNELYKSTLFEFDPMETFNLRTIVTGESESSAEANGHSESEQSSNAGSRAVNSQTPQVMLAGNKDYATSAADSTSSSAGQSEATEQNSSTAEESSRSETAVNGYQGVPSDILMAFRTSIINVDMMIIDELSELFMGVWNNGDEYTTRNGVFF